MPTETIYFAILLVYLVLMLVVGYIASRVSLKTPEDYFTGSRNFGPWLIAFTYSATMASGGVFIGTAGMTHGLGWSASIWANGIAPLGAVLAWILLGNRLRYISQEIGALTLPDIMAERYESKSIRIFAAVGMIVFLVPFLAAQIMAAGIVADVIYPISYRQGVIIFGILITLYTVIGGVRAVIWTDLFQGAILAGCFLVLTPLALARGGGLSNVLNVINTQYPHMATATNGFFTPLMIASWVLMFVFGVNLAMPHTITRFLFIKDRAVGRKAFPVSITFNLWVWINITLVSLAGKVLYPAVEGDSLLPHLVQDLMPNVLGGIVFVALIAAMMSTVDSILIMISSAISRDLFQKVFHKSASDKAVYQFSLLAVVIVGMASIAIALKPPGSILFLMSVSMGCTIPLFLYPMLGATHFKRMNSQGALWGMILGVAAGVLWALFSGWDIFVPALVSIVFATIGTLVGTYTAPPPKQEIIAKFWGTI